MPLAKRQTAITANSGAYILHELETTATEGDYLVLDVDRGVTIVASVEFTSAVGVNLIPEVSLGPNATPGSGVWYPVQGVSVTEQRAVGTVRTEGAYRFATTGWFFFRMRLANITSGSVSVYSNWVEGTSGRDGATSPTDDKITLIDEASDTVTYIGSALAASLTASGVWRIKRLTESGTSVSIEFAVAGSYDQVWDDRASLSYS